MIIQVDHGVGPPGRATFLIRGLEVQAKRPNCGISF
jgi:hypothetical protein